MTHITVLGSANVIAFVISLPVLIALALISLTFHAIVLVPVSIAVVLGVLPNPASIGLQAVSRELADFHFVRLSTSWVALRAYWRSALLTWVVSVLGTTILVVNLGFYAHFNSQAAAGLLEVLVVVILFFWFAMHLYIAPLLLAQTESGLLRTYRNAALMVMAQPLYTGIVVTFWLLLLFISTATGITAVLGLAIGAGIQQNAFIRILPRFRME